MSAAGDVLRYYQHVIKEFNLIMGSKGVFEFRVDGELLYSKKTMQMRHAEPGEILKIFRQYVGPNVEEYPQE